MPINYRAHSFSEWNPVERNVAYSVLHLGSFRKYYWSTETVQTASCKEILMAELGFQVSHTPAVFPLSFIGNRLSSCMVSGAWYLVAASAASVLFTCHM